MKKFQLLFTTVVWTAFLTLFLVRRGADTDPYAGLEFGQLEGESLGVLEVPRGPHRLSGFVFQGVNIPTGDVLVELVSVDPPLEGSPWSTRTDSSGMFLFERLPAGRYAAHLVGPGRPSIRYETPVPASVRWRLPLPYDNPATLPMLVQTTLAGAIAPPVGWSVETHPLDGFEVVLEPSVDSDPLSGALRRRTRTDPSGGFRFEDLAHEAYDLYVLPPWAVDGDWPKLTEESRRHRGEERPITIRLRSGALDVSLLREDGSAVDGALVQVWPRAQPGRVWPLATTDENGRVAIEHLPPAFYVVRAHAGNVVVEREVEVRIGQREPFAVVDWTRD